MSHVPTEIMKRIEEALPEDWAFVLVIGQTLDADDKGRVPMDCSVLTNVHPAQAQQIMASLSRREPQATELPRDYTPKYQTDPEDR